MSRTEEEITRETEGTEEPCGVIVDEMDNILHMANEINQILVFHTGRFTNNLFSNLPNDVEQEFLVIDTKVADVGFFLFFHFYTS